MLIIGRGLVVAVSWLLLVIAVGLILGRGKPVEMEIDGPVAPFLRRRGALFGVPLGGELEQHRRRGRAHRPHAEDHRARPASASSRPARNPPARHRAPPRLRLPALACRRRGDRLAQRLGGDVHVPFLADGADPVRFRSDLPRRTRDVRVRPAGVAPSSGTSESSHSRSAPATSPRSPTPATSRSFSSGRSSSSGPSSSSVREAGSRPSRRRPHRSS